MHLSIPLPLYLWCLRSVVEKDKIVSLAAYLLMYAVGPVDYAFQQIHKVAYPAIGLIPSNELRHVTAQVVESGQVQVFLSTQYWVHIGYPSCGP